MLLAGAERAHDVYGRPIRQDVLVREGVVVHTSEVLRPAASRDRRLQVLALMFGACWRLRLLPRQVRMADPHIVHGLQISAVLRIVQFTHEVYLITVVHIAEEDTSAVADRMLRGLIEVGASCRSVILSMLETDG